VQLGEDDGMRVLVIGGQKGGSGKTTASVAVAVEMVRRGLRVVLVDADPQRSASTWAELAAETGNPSPTVIAMGATMHRPDQLPALAAAYDIAVIDLPPRLDAVQRSALMAADVVVLPVGPSPTETWAVSASLALVEEARIVRPELRPVLMLTRVPTGQRLAASARVALAEAGAPLMATELGQRAAYPASLAAGTGPTVYAPRDRAAVEVRALVDELIILLGGESIEDARSDAA
jgi:chromosome partitioning protein